MGRVSKGLYRCIRKTLEWVYPSTRVVGTENLPEGPCIIVGNHAQIHGPIACELFIPGLHYIWCAAEMMHLKEVPAYAYQDFWAEKPRSVRWLFKIASYLIAPLSVCVFGNANCIPVRRDSRAISTFRETLERLDEGARIVIFPECRTPGNGLVWQFQNGFVGVARMYYARTGKVLRFVPLYVAPTLRTLALGEPIAFDPHAPAAQERERICAELMKAITRTAHSLPDHIAVPYPNLPRRDYPHIKQERESRS